MNVIYPRTKTVFLDATAIRPNIKSRNTIAKHAGIQKGAKTHHQDHVICPVNFITMNINPKIEKIGTLYLLTITGFLLLSNNLLNSSNVIFINK